MSVSHYRTLVLEGRTWVYYSGDQSRSESFDPLIEWCNVYVLGRVTYGSSDKIHTDTWIKPFIFDNKDDAMRFKLSF